MNKIISFNCDGKWSNFEAINQFIIDHQPTISLLQDTPTAKDQEISTLNNELGSINNNKMTIIYNKHLATPRLETIENICSNNIQIQAVQFKIKGIISPINIYNTYIRPKTSSSELMNTLQSLRDHLKTMGSSRSIIMGDCNSISNEWCPPSKTFNLSDSRTNNMNKSYINLQLTRGRLIKNFLDQNKLTCINNTDRGCTYYNKHYKTEAYIDIAITGNKCLRTWRHMETTTINTRGNRSQGHKIIIIKQKTRQLHQHKKHITSRFRQQPTPYPTSTQLKPTHSTRLTDALRKLNHQDQIKTLNRTLTNIKIDKNWIQKTRPEQIKIMNDLAECIYEYLSQIQNISTKHKHSNQTQKKKITSLRIKQLAQTIKAMNNKRASKIKTKISNWIRKEAEKLTTTYPDKSETWHKMDLISELDLTDQPSAELNKDSIESIMADKFPHINRQEAIETVSQDQSNQYNDITKIPSEYEIDNAIYQVRKKKHKGYEGIRFNTFNKYMSNIKPFLIEICKISKYNSIIPNNCKTTLGKIIPKKRKGLFRIIHMATPILCVLEQIILHQLEYQIERAKKIDRRQYGFTPLRDRHDLITRLIERIITNKEATRNRGHSTIISMDIKGAFDNVDHNTIINKLYQTFGYQSNITKWISQYLMDKEIVLEYKNIRSNPVKICKGVPQGSCLGPALWNFAIENITTYMNNVNPDTLEILTYADDVIIIAHNHTALEEQKIIDTINQQFNDIKLEFDPDKCSIMFTKTNLFNTREGPIIKAKHIPKTKDMIILGVHFNYQLKLKLSSICDNEKLRQNIHRLERSNTLGIISKKAEWDIIINSYIRSIIINNNFPILAIDKLARKKIDNYMIKIYKHIFNWPYNISRKLIKTIMKEPSIDIQVQKLIYQKIHKEESNGYQLLQDTLENKPTHYKPYTNSIRILRRYPNPDSPLKITMSPANPHSTWYVMEQRNGSILTWIDRLGNISNTRIIMHGQYNIGHFNNMACITDLVLSTEQTERDYKEYYYNKIITLPKDNALLLALNNFKNHDQRIIAIREKLYENNWKINTITNEQTARINRLIHEKNNATKPIRTISNRPDVSDYVYNHEKMSQIANEERAEMMLNLTSFCRGILHDYATWSKLNPTWMSGKRMLLLSGMTRDSSGTLTHYKENRHHICNCQSTTSNWVFHKALECNETSDDNLDARIIQIIKEYKESSNKKEKIKEILEDNFRQQTLLRLLCKCAFK